jgi:hypothetical protein
LPPVPAATQRPDTHELLAQFAFVVHFAPMFPLPELLLLLLQANAERRENPRAMVVT